MKRQVNRRRFLAAASAVAAGIQGSGAALPRLGARTAGVDAKPALLGGKPVRTDPFPSWPVIGDGDRRTWQEVLESRQWYRGSYVDRFEKAWARRLGARFALATSSGTAGLYTGLNALEVGPGDEVIVPPYTFVATVNVVILLHALPIFVDTDGETSQIDAKKIEAAVTDRTRCIIPVHLGGNVADMDRILEISRARGIPVIEDACQSHLAEWHHQKVGTLGDLGCFSFQASKNLNSGEGGAISGNDLDLMTACAGCHNAGRAYRVGDDGHLVLDGRAGYRRNGDNRRMTEFQAALLLEQLTRLDQQARIREENAAHLSRLLEEIPGIAPARMYEGCTRNAYHLYMLRYDSEAFAGLPRARFLEALRAEGIPASGGYRPLNRETFIKRALESRAYRRIYTDRELKAWEERNRCPENDRLCEEAVWFSQSALLGSRSDMEQIATALHKIQKAGTLLRT